MQRLLTYPLVFSFVLAIGCQSKQDFDEVATSETETPADDQWLTITTRESALALAARRAGQIKKKEYEQIFADLGEGHGYIWNETIEILNRHDDTIPRLKKELSENESNARGLGAALLLSQLQVEEGRSFLVKVLAQGDADDRIRVLNGIDCAKYDSESKRKHCEFLFADDHLAEELIRQLDDDNSEVVQAAIQTCGMLEVPGTHSKLLSLLARPDVPDRGRVLFWLSKGPLTQEVLDAAIEVSREPESQVDYWGGTLFQAFARGEDKELGKRARSEMKRQLAAWPDEKEVGYRGDRIGTLTALAETSSSEDLEWLKATFEKERGYYAEPLLVALVRLEGDAGRSRLLKLLQDPEDSSTAVQAAGEAFADSADEEVVRELAQLAEKSDEQETLNICYALQAIGGDLARKELLKLIDQIDPAYRATFITGLQPDGPGLEEFKTRLVSAGLIDETAGETALKQAVAEAEEEETGSPGILDLMTAAKILVWFDAESDMLPCRHDQLVADFAANSRGIFTPTAVSEEFHQENEEDYDAEYTLRFVFGGKLYAGRLRNFGDWYDVERTVFMINQALADAKHQERFIALATGDQTASFVFADPKIFKPIAEEFHVALGEDPNEAMDKGQAFEREVLDKLKEDFQ